MQRNSVFLRACVSMQAESNREKTSELRAETIMAGLVGTPQHKPASHS